ncbi:MAG TPA: VOC family protein [Solirubrobacteraceae bacterium]|nr:VOC family protein [Solirubrobacteraceae bacterium]
MAGATLEPYIYFKGNCRDAMEFYRGIFGGELDTVTYADGPGGTEAGDADPAWLMHASLHDGLVNLMASDTQGASETAKKIQLSISGTDEAALRGAFDGLADGGDVRMPLAEAPWGATFGSLTDRYGVEWMVNIFDGERPA